MLIVIMFSHRVALARTVQQTCRYYSVVTKPHAYLQQLKGPHAGAVGLVMDRAESRNALSVRMVNEMREAIEKVGADSSSRLLLLHTPHPNVFCAGADLKERATMSQPQVNDFLNNLRRLISELENLAIPTIAVMDGPALGGGLELALGCDLRVAGKGASKIGLPETKLGIIPGAGGTQRATRLIGLAKAKELMFTGRMIGPDEALQLGLVNYVAGGSQTAYEKALELSKMILQAAPLALKAVKQAANMATQAPSLEAGLDIERALYEPLLKTQDRDEGLLAFREKRAPVYVGR